jgi:2'-5' RNA ligase
MPRTFVALLLSEQAKRAVAAQINRLRQLSKAVTWVPPANLHLTLRFLGEQEEEQVPELVAALQEAAQEVNPFTMGLRGLGAFPGLEHPTTIWVGVSTGAPEVKYLQIRVGEALARRGVPFEHRAWQAHVTIGRIPPQKRWQRAGLADLRSGLIRGAAATLANTYVTSMELMRSDLLASGARYTPIESVPLPEA